jgi:hypothetical protein
MLVLNAVCFLKMIFSRDARECHAERAPQGLPDVKRGPLIEETSPAEAATDRCNGMIAMTPILADAADMQRHNTGSPIARIHPGRNGSSSCCTRRTIAAGDFVYAPGAPC